MSVIKMNLIHYGATQYEPDKFQLISNIKYRIKPNGGFWTSPVDSKYGWRDWCIDNDYGDTSRFIKLLFSGIVLIIDNFDDLESLPWIKDSGRYYISFEELCFDYDAIHLTEKGEQETRSLNPKSLYGWDCETVLVMNPESIVEGQEV